MRSRPHLYHVYSDESSVNQSDYMVIGATVGKPCSLDALAKRIDALDPKPGVMKWDKLRNHKLQTYLKALDIFFEMNSRREIDFHAIILESRNINHRKFSAGDGELGFGKFLYYLYCGFPVASRYGKSATFICRPDYRKTKYKLESLKEVLNSTFPARTGGVSRPGETFRSIDWCNEEDHRAAQINDLLTGATGFLVNGRKSTGKDNSKELLARYVLHWSPHAHFSENGPHSEWHFRLWHFKLEV